MISGFILKHHSFINNSQAGFLHGWVKVRAGI